MHTDKDPAYAVNVITKELARLQIVFFLQFVDVTAGTRGTRYTCDPEDVSFLSMHDQISPSSKVGCIAIEKYASYNKNYSITSPTLAEICAIIEKHVGVGQYIMVLAFNETGLIRASNFSFLSEKAKEQWFAWGWESACPKELNKP